MAASAAAAGPEVTPLTYSVADAAVALGVSENMLWQLVRRGEVDSLKVGRRRLVTVASVQEFVQRRVAETTRAR